MPDEPPGPIQRRATRGELTTLAVSLIIGAAWRIAYAFHGGLWRDEAEFVAVATLPSVRESVAFLAHQESHPPLFYLLARSWFGLAGAHDTGALALALVFVVASIPAAYWAGRTFGGPRCGALAALMVSVNPSLIVFGSTVRPYGFLGVLTLISTVLAYRMVTTAEARWPALGYTAVASVMVYTHHWSWLVIGGQGLALGVMGGAWAGPRRAARLLAAQAAVLVLYLPWVSILAEQVRHGGHPAADAPVGELMGRGASQLLTVPAALGVPLLMASLMVHWWGRPKAESPGPVGVLVGIPALSVAVASVASVASDLVLPWSVSIVVPLLIVGLAVAIGTRRAGRPGLAAAGLQVLWLAAFALAAVRVSLPPRSNTRAVARVVRASIEPHDRIVLIPGYNGPSFYRYFGRWDLMTSLPEARVDAVVDYSRRVYRDLDPGPLARLMATLDSARGGCERVWLLLDVAPPRHMHGIVAEVLDSVAAKLGPAVYAGPEPRPRPSLEHLRVWRHEPCAPRGGSR